MNRSCAWCGALAAADVTVQPAVVKSVGGVKKLVRAARVVPACLAHADITDGGTPPPAEAAAQAGSRPDDRVRRPQLTGVDVA